MDWTAVTPLVGLVLAAGAGGTVAYRLGLFRPPEVVTPERQGGLEGAAPLFLGAFAVYCVSMIGGLVAAGLTGLRLSPPAGAGGEASPPMDLFARTQLLGVVLALPVAVAVAVWTWRLATGDRGSGGGLELTPARTASLAAGGVLWGLCVLPVVFAIGVIAGQLSEWMGRPVDRAAHSMLKVIMDPKVDAGPRWMLIAVAVAGVPVLEELCFRGLLQRGVAVSTKSQWAAVLGTSTLFTLMHVGAIPGASLVPALVQLFALSVLLGLLVAKTGSVATSMVVHGMFNAVSIAVTVLGV